MPGPGRPFQKGASGNPKGRAPKTDAQREAETLLRDADPDAARRLLQLEQSSDEKVALAAVVAHLKFTQGEKMRTEVNDVTERSPLASATVEELVAVLALVRAKKGTT